MGTNFYKKVNPEDDKNIVNEADDNIHNPPSQVRNFFHSTRVGIINLFSRTKQDVDSVITKTQLKEEQFKKSLISLEHDPKDKLFPGLTYTAIGIMTGMIITRRMRVGYKIGIPTLLGLACFQYNLRGTSAYLRNKIYEYEKVQFPTMTKKQDEVMMELREGLSDCREFGSKVKKYFNEEKKQ